MLRRLYFLVSMALGIVLLACGSSSTPDAPSAADEPVASPPAAATAPQAPAANPSAPLPAAVEDPDGQRMLEWARDLSFEIGPRVSGQAS
jgi:cytochrome c5